MANANNPERTTQASGENQQTTGKNPQNPSQSGNQSSTPEAKGPTSVQGSARNPGQSGATGNSGQGDYTFRCADVGFKECDWQTHGSSPDEVLRNAEHHGRQQHNLTNIDEETRDKVRSNIRKAA
jgi:predicted small metal-binding protein